MKQLEFQISISISSTIFNQLLNLKKTNQITLKYNFMTILGLAESFKMINRPDPTVTLFDGLFLGKSKR